jgi:hypothetical protein
MDKSHITSCTAVFAVALMLAGLPVAFIRADVSNGTDDTTPLPTGTSSPITKITNGDDDVIAPASATSSSTTVISNGGDDIVPSDHSNAGSDASTSTTVTATTTVSNGSDDTVATSSATTTVLQATASIPTPTPTPTPPSTTAEVTFVSSGISGSSGGSSGVGNVTPSPTPSLGPVLYASRTSYNSKKPHHKVSLSDSISVDNTTSLTIDPSNINIMSGNIELPPGIEEPTPTPVPAGGDDQVKGNIAAVGQGDFGYMLIAFVTDLLGGPKHITY